MSLRLPRWIAQSYARAQRSLLRQPTVILFERSAEEAFEPRHHEVAAR